MRIAADARLWTGMDDLAMLVAGLDDDEGGRMLASMIVGMIEEAARCELPTAGSDEPLVVLQRRFARAAGRLRAGGAAIGDGLAGRPSEDTGPGSDRAPAVARRSAGVRLHAVT